MSDSPNTNSFGEEVEPAREATKKSTDKKCMACGGPLIFSPKIGGMVCEYCDTPAPKEEPAPDQGAGAAEEGASKSAVKGKQVMEQDFYAAEKTANCDWGVKKKTIVCKSCGAHSIYDANQISSSCPYCDSTQVMEEADQDTMAPNGICPFKITKEQANASFKKWINSSWFTPNSCRKGAMADKFNGIYLPYWTFDTHTVTKYTGKYGIDREEEDDDGNKHTTTDWYDCSGIFQKFIDDYPEIATNKQNKSHLKGILPFDTESAIPYSPEYVAGFIAERYSIGLKEGWESAQKGIKNILESDIEEKIRKQHHADHSDVRTMDTDYKNLKYKYLMLPIWLSSFRYNNKPYQFMVNGRTGKVSGNKPISGWKVFFTILFAIFVLWLCFQIFSE